VKGRKTGGGSRKGRPNKATAAKAAAVAASGLTPLDYMLEVMRSPCPPELLAAVEAGEIGLDVVKALSGWHAMRMDAAKGAAPYVHPKLAQVEHTGAGGGPVEHAFSSDRDFLRWAVFLMEEKLRRPKETA